MTDVDASNELRDLAEQLADLRSAFAHVYDAMRLHLGDESLPTFKGVARQHRSNAAAILAALMTASERGRLVELCESLIEKGVGPVVIPQQIVSARRGFDDSTLVVSGTLRAMRRVCLIQIDGKAAGTGFLVGPHLVMTAWHVVSNLDPRQAAADSGKRIRLRFDRFTYGEEDARAAVSNGWLLCGCETLDYAIIALSTAPGFERGWMKIAECAANPKKGDILAIFQHPLAADLRQSDGRYLGELPESLGRQMLYEINSGQGSSGGLVVDAHFGFAGVHCGALKGSETENVGTHGTAIVEHVTTTVGMDALERPDPDSAPRFRQVGNRGPILGRRHSVDLISQCRRGERQMCTVASGGEQDGKSFTVSIMQACLPDGDHVIRSISASALDPEARPMATQLLELFNCDSSDLPADVDADSSQVHAIKNLLVPTFLTRLDVGATIVSGPTDGAAQTRWLVIDDIQKYPMVNGSGRVFLEELYASLAAAPRLRIVLIGFTGKPPNVDQSRVGEEFIEPVMTGDIERYLQLRYRQKDWQPGLDEIARMAKLTAKAGRGGIKQLSEFVSSSVDWLFDEGA